MLKPLKNYYLIVKNFLTELRFLPPTFPYWAKVSGEDLLKKFNRSLNGGEVVWNLASEKALPASDHIEMSGYFSSHIVSYAVEEDNRLLLEKHLAFPLLRMKPNITSSTYSVNLEEDAVIKIDGERLTSEYAEEIGIKGNLRILSDTKRGAKITRTFYPAVSVPALIEEIKLKNVSGKKLNFEISTPPENKVYADKKRTADGSVYVTFFGNADALGNFKMSAISPVSIDVEDNGSAVFYFVFSASKTEENLAFNAKDQIELRKSFINEMFDKVCFISPDNNINAEFAHTALRGAESLFKTPMGLVHSPGGGVYYAAIWTNDQIEYSAPFFAYLGYAPAVEATKNAINLFTKQIDFNNLEKGVPCSIASGGDYVWNLAGDRGDALMLASGALRFALTLGDKKYGVKIWQMVKWAIDYSNYRMGKDGVISSTCDELEGRFHTGTYNLFTNCLFYDTLLSASYLGGDLDIENDYYKQAQKLKENINKYFSANIKGYDAYKYFKHNKALRSWVCVPLTVDIFDKTEGVTDAVYGAELYSGGRLKTQEKKATSWDRALAFALRGTFRAGKTEKSIDILKEFTDARLLGNHSPYMEEAFPEGNRRQLSAESVLYSRIMFEGILGYRPTGLSSFTLKPSMPKEWNFMKMTNLSLCGKTIDIEITKKAKLTVTISEKGKVLKTYETENNIEIKFDFKETI